MGAHVGGRAVAGALIVGLLGSCAMLRRWIEQPPPEIPRPAGSLPEPLFADAGVVGIAEWVEGPVLRAMRVAIGDLTLRAQYDALNVESPDALQLVECLAREDAYDAQLVGQETDRFIVYVRPRAERCFPRGDWLKGGDATYEVARSDYRLLSVKRGE